MQNYVKKVPKYDLERLVLQLYRIFISQNSIDDENALPRECQAKSYSTSTYIELWWYTEDTKLEIDDAIKARIEKFSSVLKEISFGNLNVAFHKKDKMGDKTIITIYIANAYEVIS